MRVVRTVDSKAAQSVAMTAVLSALQMVVWRAEQRVGNSVGKMDVTVAVMRDNSKAVQTVKAMVQRWAER